MSRIDSKQIGQKGESSISGKESADSNGRIFKIKGGRSLSEREDFMDEVFDRDYLSEVSIEGQVQEDKEELEDQRTKRTSESERRSSSQADLTTKDREREEPKSETSKRSSEVRERSSVSKESSRGVGGDEHGGPSKGGDVGRDRKGLDEQDKAEMKRIFKIQSKNLETSYPLMKQIRQKPFMGSLLENHLNEQDLETLMKAFENYPEKEMDLKEFQEELLDKVNLDYGGQQLEEMFTKMDINKNGKVGWDEFLSFVLLEMQVKTTADVMEDLVLPLSGQPRVTKSHHRFPIVRMAFFPVMQPDRTTNFLIGRYASISRDGRINYWTLDFELDGWASAAVEGHRITESWITDMVCLPDARTVCVSSTSKDLNFFDTTAKKFEIRMSITHLPHPVVTMGYYFYKEKDLESHLVCGDLEGNVIVFNLYNYRKGPFQYTHSETHSKARLDQVLKGHVKNLTARQFLGLHSDVVKQVGFFGPIRCALSCAATAADSLAMTSISGVEPPNIFNQPRGVTCFCVIEEKHLVVMGCMNGSVLGWDVYVSNKTSFQLVGHCSPVITVVVQEEGRRVYSMARDRSVKCWDVGRQKCIQTYLGVPADLGATISLSFSYNEVNRNLVIAGINVGVLVLGAAVDSQRCDGFTHTMGVVRVLYNALYKCVVSVGIDSVIMVWDIWEGKRLLFIRDAHTRTYYGVRTPIEITAASFDPAFQYLITGARDGSVKIWNFQMGYCVRSMNIQPFCEVTGIVWMEARILIAGWDRRVTEFSDEDPFAEPKVWETRHTDDVLCMAFRLGQSIATSSYNGELILWRAETGRAYRRYNVTTPRDRIVLTYTKEKKSLVKTSKVEEKQSPYSFRKETDELEGYRGLSMYKPPGQTKDFVLRPQDKLRDRRRSSIAYQQIQESRRNSAFLSSNVSMKVSTSSLRQSLQGQPSQAKSSKLKREQAMAQKVAAIIKSVHMQSQEALHTLPSRGDDADAVAADFNRRNYGRRGSMRRGSEAIAVATALRLARLPKPVRRVSVVKLPEVSRTTVKLYVTAMTFLNTRPMLPQWGTLFVAINNGQTQVWSHHPGGSCMGSFLSIHMAGDYVTAMTSDKDNQYLITGTSLGYIKIWLMANYAFPEADKVRVSMPLLRLQFPFLWSDRVDGRAKRSLRDQPLPLLLSSYRGHLLAVNSIDYMNDHKLVLTASSDTTVRLWCLSGVYLGTLGGLRKWSAFREHVPPHEAVFADSHAAADADADSEEYYRVPADVRLVMSSTTFKVMMAGNVPRTHYKEVDDSDLLHDLPERLLAKATYGRRPGSPLLGKAFPSVGSFRGWREPTEQPPVLDASTREIPVYSHLRIIDLEEIKKPRKPLALVEMQNRQRHLEPRAPSPRKVRASVKSFIGSLIGNLSKATEGKDSVSKGGGRKGSSRKGSAMPDLSHPPGVKANASASGTSSANASSASSASNASNASSANASSASSASNASSASEHSARSGGGGDDED